MQDALGSGLESCTSSLRGAVQDLTPRLLLVAAAAIGLLTGTAGAEPTRPSLVLVTVDTLRADRLHAYGYQKAETPVTDRLARDGVLVEHATVQVPQTRPSHVSILTGRLPFEHGVRDNYSPPLRSDMPTLASILRENGYETAAFIGAVPLTALSGLDRGFSVYDDPFSGGAPRGGVRPAERRAVEVVDSALAWLDRSRTSPFFAWVHLFDPHAPYEPPAPYDRRHAEQPYDGEVAYCDAQVGRLLEHLDRTGLAPSTLVVVTSDHGEGLGEHGEDEHLMFVYDSTLRVPLLLSWPGVLPAGARVSGQFRSVDLLPTLLDLMGVLPVSTSGVSRAATLRSGGIVEENDSYAESLYGSLHFGYAPLRALRAGAWKYIEAPRPELYHVDQDPGETRNLVAERPQVATRMRERLGLLDTGAVGADSPSTAADAGVLERLVALGYLAGGTSQAKAGGGADPKDVIGEHQSYKRQTQEAVRLFRAGDVDAALPLLEALAQGEIVSFEALYFLGKGLLAKGRHAEAARHLESAIALLPSFAPTHVDLATAYRELGRLEEAQAVLERGLEAQDGDVALLEALGAVQRIRDDLPGATTTLERAISLDPESLRLRMALSAAYRDGNRLDDAIREVREALRLAPRFVSGWNALGLLLTATGRTDQALEAFQTALKAGPDDPDVLFNLAAAHLRAGRAREAVPLLETLMVRAPRYPGAAAALRDARQAAGDVSLDPVRLRLLLVRQRSEAREAARRLEDGESFAALASAMSLDPSASAGGDLGLVKLEDLAEPLRSAAARLTPGQVSPVLATRRGFAILKREP